MTPRCLSMAREAWLPVWTVVNGLLMSENRLSNQRALTQPGSVAKTATNRHHH